MAQFMMLLRENPAGFAEVSAQEMQAVIQEYLAWRKALTSRDQLRGGAKLRDEGGKRLAGGPTPVVSDGPYAEAHEVIGGFFIVEAADYDAAVKLAGSCPHLKYGTIELREIEPT